MGLLSPGAMSMEHGGSLQNVLPPAHVAIEFVQDLKDEGQPSQMGRAAQVAFVVAPYAVTAVVTAGTGGWGAIVPSLLSSGALSFAEKTTLCLSEKYPDSRIVKGMTYVAPLLGTAYGIATQGWIRGIATTAAATGAYIGANNILKLTSIHPVAKEFIKHGVAELAGSSASATVDGVQSFMECSRPSKCGEPVHSENFKLPHLPPRVVAPEHVKSGQQNPITTTVPSTANPTAAPATPKPTIVTATAPTDSSIAALRPPPKINTLP